MIKTTKMLEDELLNYSNKSRKIKSMVKQNKLIKICRGLYENNPNVSGLCIANAIYGPSYISFNKALEFYGMIPERIYAYTSATFGKNKSKIYKNKIGVFTYNDVPKSIYYKGIKVVELEGYTFAIATPEKALCDMLYSLKPCKSVNELGMIIFESLRINIETFSSLKFKDILELSKGYHCKNIYLLVKLIKENNYEQYC